MIGFMPAPFCNAVIFVNMHVLAIEEELSLGLSSWAGSLHAYAMSRK
jgi:hypothetical protein